MYGYVGNVSLLYIFMYIKRSYKIKLIFKITILLHDNINENYNMKN